MRAATEKQWLKVQSSSRAENVRTPSSVGTQEVTMQSRKPWFAVNIVRHGIEYATQKTTQWTQNYHLRTYVAEKTVYTVVLTLSTSSDALGVRRHFSLSPSSITSYSAGLPRRSSPRKHQSQRPFRNQIVWSMPELRPSRRLETRPR